MELFQKRQELVLIPAQNRSNLSRLVGVRNEHLHISDSFYQIVDPP